MIDEKRLDELNNVGGCLIPAIGKSAPHCHEYYFTTNRTCCDALKAVGVEIEKKEIE